MSFPTIHIIFGLVMMSALTIFVLSFTANTDSLCKGTEDQTKCLALMGGMKSLIYFSWPVYIGGIVILSLLMRQGKKYTQTFDAGWTPDNVSQKESTK